MKKTLLLVTIALLCALTISSCKDKLQTTADYNVIPLPQSIENKEGKGFVINASTAIVYPEGNETLKKTAGFLAEYLKFANGTTLKVTDKPTSSNAIILKADYANDNKEAYVLDVTAEQVIVNGASEAGTFYGVQTLRKAVPADSGDKDILLPPVNITDYPRFAYRGMMLDVARHYFSTEFIKEYIDILALHNINTFHLHLTEDQGWRIEIKKYPKLTEIGSQRKETLVGHLNEKPWKFDGKPHGGFYTQDQLKDIVAYAADRHITIIPEIDLPGHMLAALAAYPNLGCTGGPYEVGTRWGVFEDVLCMGNKDTFTFLEDVLSEVLEIFPSKYIHIGGDECPKVRWAACPKCQAKIKELGLKSDKKHSAEERLQSYCTSRIEKFLNDKGRAIIGWDEILEGGLAPNATVMSWRGTEGGIAAAEQGHEAIMCPYQYLYFDYKQAEDASKEPLSIGGFLPVEKVYNYEPIPNTLTDQQKKYIIGVQANLWTEYIISDDLAEYMVLPRIDALSEIQWLTPEKKNYESFKTRLLRMKALYDKYGYNYAKHVFEAPAPDTQENKETK